MNPIPLASSSCSDTRAGQHQQLLLFACLGCQPAANEAALIRGLAYVEGALLALEGCIATVAMAVLGVGLLWMMLGPEAPLPSCVPCYLR